MVACNRKEQVVSERKRKNFSGEFKDRAALEAIRGVIVQEGCQVDP